MGVMDDEALKKAMGDYEQLSEEKGSKTLSEALREANFEKEQESQIELDNRQVIEALSTLEQAGVSKGVDVGMEQSGQLPVPATPDHEGQSLVHDYREGNEITAVEQLLSESTTPSQEAEKQQETPEVDKDKGKDIEM